MDEVSAVKYASWCCYCLCAGCGSSALSTPAHVDCKCCVCFEVCRHAEGPCIGKDGATSCVAETCCCISAWQYPARPGLPCLMCCDGELCPSYRHGRGRTGAHHDSHELAVIHPHDAMIDHCVLWYCCCTGLAVFPPNFGQCMSHKTTCGALHAHGGTYMANCSEESWHYGWLGYYLACGQLYSHCKVPFHCRDSPIMACCGRKCRHRSH